MIAYLTILGTMLAGAIAGSFWLVPVAASVLILLSAMENWDLVREAKAAHGLETLFPFSVETMTNAVVTSVSAYTIGYGLGSIFTYAIP